MYFHNGGDSRKNHVGEIGFKFIFSGNGTVQVIPNEVNTESPDTLLKWVKRMDFSKVKGLGYTSC